MVHGAVSGCNNAVMSFRSFSGVRVDADLDSEVVAVVAHDDDISSGDMKYYIYNSTFHKVWLPVAHSRSICSSDN